MATKTGSISSATKMAKEEFSFEEGYQVYVKSPTAKSGWIAQGQPHKTLAKAWRSAEIGTNDAIKMGRVKKRTSIGNSVRSSPKNKSKKRN